MDYGSQIPVNFVLFSKILPLLFYPLGLVFILLIIGLIIWWKYPRFLPIPLCFALTILWLSGNIWVSNLLVKSLEWQYLITAEEIPNAAAMVILGGGMKPHIYPRPMVDVAEQGDRVIYGAKLYKMGKSPLIVPSGGRLSWREGKSSSSEAEDMTELLLLFDIPESAIIQENRAVNTRENAVFTREILSGLGINDIILVTSALHMPRSVKIFEKQGFKVYPAPTDFLVTESDFSGKSSWQDNVINFFPNPSRLNHTTSAIKEYLGLWAYRLKGWA